MSIDRRRQAAIPAAPSSAKLAPALERCPGFVRNCANPTRDAGRESVGNSRPQTTQETRSASRARRRQSTARVRLPRTGVGSSTRVDSTDPLTREQPVCYRPATRFTVIQPPGGSNRGHPIDCPGPGGSSHWEPLRSWRIADDRTPAIRVGRNLTHDARDPNRWPDRADSVGWSVPAARRRIREPISDRAASRRGVRTDHYRDRIGPTGGSLADASAYVRYRRGADREGTRRASDTSRQEVGSRFRTSRSARRPKNWGPSIGRRLRRPSPLQSGRPGFRTPG